MNDHGQNEATTAERTFQLLWTGNGRLLWLASSATSIITSKCLLSGELNYPLYLVLFQLAAVSATQTYLARHGYRSERLDGPSMLASIIYNAAICACLVLGYKTLSYSSSLPIAMLLISLDWLPAHLIHGDQQWRVVLRDVVPFLCLILGMTLIYIGDYRMDTTSRDMSMYFVFTVGLTQLFCHLIHSHWRPSEWSLVPLFPPSVANFHPCFLVPVGIAAFFLEKWRSTTWIPLFTTGMVLVLNLTATAMAFLTGGFVFKPFRFAYHPTDKRSEGNRHFDRIILMFALVGFVSAGNWLFLSLPAVISKWQIAGFCLAFFAYVTFDDIHGTLDTLGKVFSKRETRYESISLDQDAETPNRELCEGPREYFSDFFSFAAFALGCFGWLFFLITAFSFKPGDLSFDNTKLDSEYQSPIALDIVVARYHQPAEQLIHNLHALLEPLESRQLVTRIMIYNKNPDTEEFASSIAEAKFDNMSVLNLENVGREGDTYLHHIVTNWDDMATHTLFMQADPHDFKLLERRLAEYLVPETGFMSLSYQGNMCSSCEHCHDQYWSQDPAVLSSLYSKANTGECHDLVLSYRGQFVVSGARIRGNRKSMYEEMLHDLRDPESWMHSADFTQSVWNSGDVDSLNAPVFGYTLERMWGVLMQCSTLRVGHWSPSLLSSYFRSKWLRGKYPLEDVQCLDRAVVYSKQI